VAYVVGGTNRVPPDLPLEKTTLESSYKVCNLTLMFTSVARSTGSNGLPWIRSDYFPLYLAPMAGFTDIAYRQLCKQYGADVVISEFVMCEAILRDVPGVWESIEFTESQRPMGVQIFGSQPDRMAQAARRICDRIEPDFIDINFGCPSDKVTKAAAGCSLLKDLPLLAAIAQAVRGEISERPVTAKIRLGWDSNTLVASEAASLLEESGMETITIHGRTRMQGYKGDADMSIICQVAAERSVPVIANGSVEDLGRIDFLATKSACAGAMIGRAALGNPWIFHQIREFLQAGIRPQEPTLEMRIDALQSYAKHLMESPLGQHHGSSISWLKPKLKSLLKNFPQSRRARMAIDQARTPPDLFAILDGLQDIIQNQPIPSGSLC